MGAGARPTPYIWYRVAHDQMYRELTAHRLAPMLA